MVKPYLNQVGGNVDDDVSLFSGGLNTYVDKAFLESDQMPYVMNMQLGRAPGIHARNPRVTIAKYMADNKWPADHLPEGIVDMFSYNSNHIFAIAGGTNNKYLYDIFRASGSTNYSVRSLCSVNEEDKYYFTIAKQQKYAYLYITGETFKLKVEIDDATPQFAGVTPVEDDKYGICCIHKGRLFLADPHTNTITFSCLFDFDNFDEVQLYYYAGSYNPLDPYDFTDANPDYIYLFNYSSTQYLQYQWDGTQWVELADKLSKDAVTIDKETKISIPDYSQIAGQFYVTNAVGSIVSIKSFDDKLIIFCEHSMHVIYGDTPDMSLENHFQLVDLNNNLGALADRCIAIGGGRLFWLGDNNEIYEYSGASINMISRPGKTRNSTLSVGAVSGVIDAKLWEDLGASHAKFTATAEKLYVDIWNANNPHTRREKLLFIFDIYNRTWWCEDGDFDTIADYEAQNDTILIGLSNGDILINNQGTINTTADNWVDEVYDFTADKAITKDINYEVHTRVYGADGADLRESLARIWVQGYANADVYLNDIWLSYDYWHEPDIVNQNLLKIGALTRKTQSPTQLTRYREDTYEQNVCYVEKMYGQRLNTFQIIIKGTGKSSFYLMKRVWRAR